MDKTSVLGETIKHLRKLQEKVKTLEEVAAKHTVESVLVVKKSQLVMDYDDGESGVSDKNDSASSFNVDCNNNKDDSSDSLPQVEVKVSDKHLLFRFYCEKQKEIMPKLFGELEKHGLTVISTNIIPFGALAMDITILAQMETGFDMDVRDIIRSLHSTLRPQARPP